MLRTYIKLGDQFSWGSYMDSLTGVMYSGHINYDSIPIMVSEDTLFPGLSASYSRRVWSVNENQVIIDTYYDGNGFSYSVPHNYIRNLDTLIINFQSGDIKKFVINELTVEKLNITSIDEKKYTPIFDGNGIYRDTVLMSLTSEEYLFDLAQ
jgi:hypothetical protein